jgi:glycosyltransferase 2 family protein
VRRVLEPAAVTATFVVSMIFGYLAVRDVRFYATWHAVRTSNLAWLVPSLGALALAILLRVFRWRALFQPESRPPLRSLAKATLLGYFFNSILPLRAGEAARIEALKRYSGTSRAESTATVVLERIIDVSSLIVLLFLLLPWLPPIAWLGAAGVAAAVCLGAVLGLALFARHVSRLPRPRALQWLTALPGVREERAVRLTKNAVSGLAALAHARQAVATLAWTFMSWFVLGLSFWLLMLGFDLNLSLMAGLLVVIATGLAFIIPAAPGAIGVFEAAGIAAMKAYGADPSDALGYVLVLHALNLFPFLIAGVIVLSANTRRSG